MGLGWGDGAGGGWDRGIVVGAKYERTSVNQVLNTISLCKLEIRPRSTPPWIHPCRGSTDQVVFRGFDSRLVMGLSRVEEQRKRLLG